MSSNSSLFRPGAIEIIVGPMFSGKTAELIERGKRVERYMGKKVLYFKPIVDDRDLEIKSRNGMACEAYLFEDPQEILQVTKELEEPALILIDEVQFARKSIIHVIELMTDQMHNHNVVASGLNTTFVGIPFEVTAHIMAIATYPPKWLVAVCQYSNDIIQCHRDATRNHRLKYGKPVSAFEEEVLIEKKGENPYTYMPVCKKHHRVLEIEEFRKERIRG